MIKIEFSGNDLKIRQQSGIHEVFDVIRKKWLVLSPEEWVRQNFIQYLLISKNYPASLIAIEKEIKLGELKKRCDIVVYNRKTAPWMIIECKEMNVALSENTLAQILRYHITLPADYLIITNGSYTFGFKKEEGQFFQIDQLPDFGILG
ncbi:MAG: type I restriction enzyme HsdR N-terminal domain-containing protein [Ginsengibacter sp.]